MWAFEEWLRWSGSHFIHQNLWDLIYSFLGGLGFLSIFLKSLFAKKLLLVTLGCDDNRECFNADILKIETELLQTNAIVWQCSGKISRSRRIVKPDTVCSDIFRYICMIKMYHNVWLEQMNLWMLQQEAGCQPPVLSPFTTSTTQTRQFSSIELKDSSDHPKLGTSSLCVAPTHLQAPSTSMSLPEVQNSLKCLLETVSMWREREVARTSLSSDSSWDCFISQCFRASIQVTFSFEI